MVDKIIKSGRLVDDCCVFCGLHGLQAGGHYFEAIKQDRLGGYITREGWVVMVHIANCEFQICPSCQTKSYRDLEQSKEDKDDRES